MWVDSAPADDPTSIYSGDSYHSRATTHSMEEKASEAYGRSEAGSAPADIEMQPNRSGVYRTQENLGPGPLDDAPFAPDQAMPGIPDLPGDFDLAAPFVDNFDSPLLLNDMPAPPPGSEFSWENIDWDMVNPEAKSTMAEWLGSDASADTSFLGSEGIGQELGLMSHGGFANFVQARMVDIGIGTVLMPFFNWIDIASGTPWVSRAIQGTMAVAGLVMTGDPFGVIAAPICWGLQEMQRQDRRKLENDNPDANFGKR